MTVKPVITTLALDRADANLSAAIKRYGVPPCWNEPDNWTGLDQSSYWSVSRSIEASRGCRSCPVFAECEDRAELVSAHDKANTVLAGVRYTGAGTPIDDAPELERQDRDRRLLALVEIGPAA